MTEETWKVELADRVFLVPRLPFKVSRKVYPICQRLSNAGMVERIFGNMGLKLPNVPEQGPFEVTDEELEDLANIALWSCQVADPTFTQDEFDAMPIAPYNLFDAFLEIRQACGGWVRKTSEGKDQPGEAEGTQDAPQTSTSTESSENLSAIST